MENSIERPDNYTVVFGDMAYDEQKDTIECPPSTVNNKKMLPKYRVPMQEGEISINIVATRYEKDENGKIVKYEDVKKEKEEEEQVI